ncbi:MAG: hypothetical protein AAGD18_11445 [Actinomycetota bacterium]
MNHRHGPAIGMLAGGSLAVAIGLTAGRWTTPDDAATELAGVTIRAALVGIGSYAALVGALALTAVVFGWGTARVWAVRLGGARWGLAVSLGVAAMASSPTMAGAATESVPAPSTQSLTPLPTTPSTSGPAPLASLVPLPVDEDDAPIVDAVDPVVAATDAAIAEWTVGQGDHLWSIAEHVVMEEQPDADDAAITGYWLALIDANRERLVVPDNPDLIVPGQQLVLPPVN